MDSKCETNGRIIAEVCDITNLLCVSPLAWLNGIVPLAFADIHGLISHWIVSTTTIFTTVSNITLWTFFILKKEVEVWFGVSVVYSSLLIYKIVAPTFPLSCLVNYLDPICNGSRYVKSLEEGPESLWWDETSVGRNSLRSSIFWHLTRQSHLISAAPASHRTT